MDGGRRWTIIVPLKGGTAAKSRLDVDAALRAGLARALATDTVTAVLASPLVERVMVLSPDPQALAHLAIDPTPSVLTLHEQPAGEDLNTGLDRTVEALRAHGGDAVAVAIVVADLPALTAVDLTSVLRAAEAARRPGVVADASGRGTTVLALPPGVGLAASFGPHSLARHAGTGAVVLSAEPSVRSDVDTLADLTAAAELGVGAATRALLDHVRT